MECWSKPPSSVIKIHLATRVWLIVIYLLDRHEIEIYILGSAEILSFLNIFLLRCACFLAETIHNVKQV